MASQVILSVAAINHNGLRMLDIKAIKARASAASPGPWVVVEYCKIESPKNSKGWPDMVIYDEGGHTPEDADFIAHSREDISALIARVEELEAAVSAALWAIDHHPEKNHPMTASEITFRGIERRP